MAAPTFANARALGMNEATLEALAAFLSGKNADTTAFALPITGTITAVVTPGVVTASTATLANVSGSASSVTVLALNTARLGATFFNDSTAVLYLKFGTTASTTSYTVQIASNGYYELPTTAVYTGRIDGIWAAANGAVRVTELAA